MNLWLRLLWLLISAAGRGSLRLPSDASVLTYRVWPHDIDLSLHMNNGRYLTIMDLGRLDVMARSGLWRATMQNRWTPIASAIAIRFRRELRPFQSYRLVTRLVCWDAALVVMEQMFLINGGPRDGELAARALFKGGLYDRREKKFVAIALLMDAIGVSAISPSPTPEVEAFLNAEGTLKQTTPR